MADFDIIHEAIDKAAEKAAEVSFDLIKDKWILFSDHHRGRKDGADDFLICEPTYKNALDYYLKEDYTLALLGDVEEFWENPFYLVLKRYKDLLELEKKFFDKNKLYRLWGNHDDQWRYGAAISKYLYWLFPNLQIHEALQMKLENNGDSLGKILLIHGHQGNLESDRLAWLSKFFVRFIWRNFQRLFKVPLSTPSNDVNLRSEHDHAMYAWAEKNENQILISGHTHQAVFMSMTEKDTLIAERKECSERIKKHPERKQEIETRVQAIDNKLIFIASREGTTLLTEKEFTQPRYFNTGCCSFSDGDITGIELVEGKIMLVKWPAGTGKKVILQSTSLKNIFA